MTNATKALLLAGGIGLVTLGFATRTPSSVVQSMKPLMVRDFNAPATRPLQFDLCSEINLASGCPSGEGTFTVPESTASGEVVTRLVIQFVSVQCSVQPLTALVNTMSLETTAGGTTLDHYFPLTSDPAFGVIGTTEDTRIYADPGTDVSLGTSWASANSGICDMSISGHFVVE